MEVPMNGLAILAAAIASMVIGFLWYGPIFGKQWMAWSGFTKKKMDEAKKKGMTKEYAIMFATSLLMAFVLSHALVFASAYLHTSGIEAGLMSGFWNWLGFIVPVTIGSVLWEGKSWKLWALNAGHHLVTLLTMGVILALWT